MAITYRHEPAAGVIGGAAFQGGLGRRLAEERRRQEDMALAEARLSQQRELALMDAGLRAREAAAGRAFDEGKTRFLAGERRDLIDKQADIAEARDERMAGIYEERDQRQALARLQAKEAEYHRKLQLEYEKNNPLKPEAAHLRNKMEEQRRQLEANPTLTPEQKQVALQQWEEKYNAIDWDSQREPLSDIQIAQRDGKPIIRNGNEYTVDHNGNLKLQGPDFTDYDPETGEYVEGLGKQKQQKYLENHSHELPSGDMVLIQPDGKIDRHENKANIEAAKAEQKRRDDIVKRAEQLKADDEKANDLNKDFKSKPRSAYLEKAREEIEKEERFFGGDSQEGGAPAPTADDGFPEGPPVPIEPLSPINLLSEEKFANLPAKKRHDYYRQAAEHLGYSYDSLMSVSNRTLSSPAGQAHLQEQYDNMVRYARGIAAMDNPRHMEIQMAYGNLVQRLENEGATLELRVNATTLLKMLQEKNENLPSSKWDRGERDMYIDIMNRLGG